MIRDKELILSADQAVTVSAASTNIIDQTKAGDALAGAELYLEILVKEAVAAVGAATVTFSIETDDNASFSSPTTMLATAAIAKATLVAGYVALKVKLPIGTEQYLRVYYTVATGPLTAGKFDAFLVADVEVR
jgi:hypothetical protein